jgi:invasion protein IalB
MQPIRFSLILAGLALALAAPVAAQDAAAPTETPAESPAADAPAAAPEAPAADGPAADAPAAEAPAETPAEGTPAAAPEGAAAAPTGQPAQPEVMEIVRDTFGQWQVRCAPDGGDCFMYQLALDAGDNPVAEVSILKLPEEADAVAGVTVVTPLGTLLTNGVVMQIDSGEARQYPFAWCSQVGCFARFGLDQVAVDVMKRGRGGKITLLSVGAPESPVTLDLSLTGFTDAYNSLEVPVPPAAGSTAPAPAPAADPAPLAPLAPRN